MPAFREDDPLRVELDLQSVGNDSGTAAVARQLVGLLTNGHLPPGSRLPPERALATSLGVGRSAVREALAALEILGIVEVRRGSGTYLRESTSELLPATLSWGLMLDAERTEELIAVRGLLEVQAAQWAAVNGSPEQIRDISAHLQEMRENVNDLGAFAEADARFHYELARTAGNSVLSELLRSVRSLLRVWVERGLRTREQAEVAVHEHTLVLEAILAGDADAAGAAMSRHMQTAGQRLLARIQDPPEPHPGPPMPSATPT